MVAGTSHRGVQHRPRRHRIRVSAVWVGVRPRNTVPAWTSEGGRPVQQRNGKSESTFNIIWDGEQVMIHFGEGARLGTRGFSPADARRLAAVFRQHAVFPKGKGFSGEGSDALHT